MATPTATPFTAESLRRKMAGSKEPTTLDKVLTHTALLLKRRQVLKTLDYNCRGIAQAAVNSIDSGTSVEFAVEMAIGVFADLVVRSGIDSADEVGAIEAFQKVMLKAIGRQEAIQNLGINGAIS